MQTIQETEISRWSTGRVHIRDLKRGPYSDGLRRVGKTTSSKVDICPRVRDIEWRKGD